MAVHGVSYTFAATAMALLTIETGAAAQSSTFALPTQRQ